MAYDGAAEESQYSFCRRLPLVYEPSASGSPATSPNKTCHMGSNHGTYCTPSFAVRRLLLLGPL